MPSKSINSLHSISRMLITFVFLIVSGAIYSSEVSSEKPLRIAVASNFLETSQKLAEEFKKASGVSVQISSGSSGKLFHQIMHGAPFDIFLSADKHKPQQLVTNSKAQPSSLNTYAKGQLMLWFKYCDGGNKLEALQNPQFKKIALANPKLAPYGASTESLIRTANLWPALKSKLVFPENIAQVAQLAKLGAVDAAFIAKTHAKNLQPDSVDSPFSCIVELSSYHYPPIEQQLVILKASKNQELARRFVLYLQSVPAQALIKNMGYLVD